LLREGNGCTGTLRASLDYGVNPLTTGLALPTSFHVNSSLRYLKVSRGVGFVMHKLVALLALSATLGWSAAAAAATVNVNSGTVSINGGKPVSGSAKVNPGDSVTAGPNGSAVISYDNGCTAQVNSGSTVSVVQEMQCSAAAGGFGGTGLLVGAAVAAGAVGIGIAVSQKDGKKKTASP
jgi:hypothetical protein